MNRPASAGGVRLGALTSSPFYRAAARFLAFTPIVMGLPLVPVVGAAFLVAWRSLLYGADPIEVPIRPSERPLPSPGFLPDKAPDGFVFSAVPEVRPEVPSGALLQVDSVKCDGSRLLLNVIGFRRQAIRLAGRDGSRDPCIRNRLSRCGEPLNDCVAQECCKRRKDDSWFDMINVRQV